MRARWFSPEGGSTTSVADATGTLSLTSDSPEQTTEYGRRLGALLVPGDVVLLEGEFGAGKTVLAQGIARGLGVTDYVASPSFTLVNEYRVERPGGAFRFQHIDLYRIESGAEVIDLGLLDDLGGDGVCVVEWAERVRDLLPPAYLLVRLRVADDTRRELDLTGYGDRHATLLLRFAGAISEA